MLLAFIPFLGEKISGSEHSALSEAEDEGEHPSSLELE
jgi:hypothetical protein